LSFNLIFNDLLYLDKEMGGKCSVVITLTSHTAYPMHQ